MELVEQLLGILGDLLREPTTVPDLLAERADHGELFGGAR
jgi:hypothetical protein